MSLFSPLPETAIYFSRSDPDALFGTWCPYSFELDEGLWETVEHYFQGMKFEDPAYRARIMTAKSSREARRLGRRNRKGLRADWSRVREVVMTRGIYVRARTWPVIAQALLDTGDKVLVENSQYDYFWGCGRDRRGENRYGQVLMNVRERLRSEAS